MIFDPDRLSFPNSIIFYVNRCSHSDARRLHLFCCFSIIRCPEFRGHVGPETSGIGPSGVPEFGKRLPALESECRHRRRKRTQERTKLT